MNRKSSSRLLHLAAVSCALLLASGFASAAITIDTVTVGNPGNTADPATGGLYGAVNYTYNIGTYEVTAEQYTAFLNAVGGVDTYHLYNTNMAITSYGSGITRVGSGTIVDPYTYSVASGNANRPVNNVSFGDAMRFANWLHNGQPTGAQDGTTTESGAYNVNGADTDAALQAVTRQAGWQWAVASEDEWYKAAYYNPGTSSYYLFPTSSNTAPGNNLLDPLGNNANFWDDVAPYPIDSPYYTTVVGEFQNSESPYGTFDQGGNVWEWNEAIIIDFDSFRGLRGGSFDNIGSILQSSFRSYTNPTVEVDFIGFRVVSQVPEPASLAILGIGVMGLLTRRRISQR